MSITTLGDANISPTTTLMRWITMFEVIVGIIWMTIILAATLGLVQEKFSTILAKKQSKKRPENIL